MTDPAPGGRVTPRTKRHAAPAARILSAGLSTGATFGLMSVLALNAPAPDTPVVTLVSTGDEDPGTLDPATELEDVEGMLRDESIQAPAPAPTDAPSTLPGQPGVTAPVPVTAGGRPGAAPTTARPAPTVRSTVAGATPAPTAPRHAAPAPTPAAPAPTAAPAPRPTAPPPTAAPAPKPTVAPKPTTPPTTRTKAS